MRIYTERTLVAKDAKWQQKFWSDCADIQTDLSIQWAHMSDSMSSQVTVYIIPCRIVYILTHLRLETPKQVTGK